MAMMGTRDKPTYYNIKNALGEVLKVVPKSKLFKELTDLENKNGEKLFHELRKEVD